MKKFNKKTVIITGGTKGIGAGISKAFYEAGYFIVMGARNDSGLDEQLGNNATFIKMDVRNEAEHQRLVQSALRKTARVDVYINCAGFSKWQAVDKIDEKFWDDMMNTNLKGTFWGCKVAARALSKGGCIINVSSLAGKRGSANNAVYCASKFGITGLTQSLAKELGPKQIRVNAVCPVYVVTFGLLEALAEKSSPAGGKEIELYLKKFAKQMAALGRLPKAEEVGKTCLFLASEDASAITGQSINVDCGVLPQ